MRCRPQNALSCYIYSSAKQIFSGLYWNQPVCLSVCLSIRVSICVQNTTFCHSTGGAIKSDSVTPSVYFGNMHAYYYVIMAVCI